ncbi:MAG TPA: redoxin domain-containing protein [Terriglobia bacterium]|nr:redoxin domain-containing protein [Terriglobia bacterium]
MLTPMGITLAIFEVATICGGVWFACYLLTQNGRLMLRLESLEHRLEQQGILTEGVNHGSLGTPPGTVLNDFALPIMGGGTMTLSQWRGRKIVLIFLSPRCKHSESLLPDLAAVFSEGVEADPAPVIISTGSAEENQRFLGEHHIGYPILLQEDSEVAALFRALATPMAYLVDENGVTEGRAAVGPTAILQLLRHQAGAAETPARDHTPGGFQGSLASSKINRDGLKAGARAPNFTLPALDGREISLSSLRGRPVLLVFSDPNCKPCNALLPKLEEVHRKSKDLRVLMIGRGDPKANRDKMNNLGLTFPVVLQRSWEISRAYGMFATPIGYLVDEDGVLVEDVAVGGSRILALAAHRRNASVPAGS